MERLKAKVEYLSTSVTVENPPKRDILFMQQPLSSDSQGQNLAVTDSFVPCSLPCRPCDISLPLSSELGTSTTVHTRFWPRLSGEKSSKSLKLPPLRSDAVDGRIFLVSARTPCRFQVPEILQFEPFLDALSSRSDVTRSIEVLSSCRDISARTP